MQAYKFTMQMTCDGCANAAKNVLKPLGDAIKLVETDLAAQTITVHTDLPQADVLRALEKTQKKVTVLS
ncbi:hypothetical protein EG68_05040 [Paragonimus skrjabini miyazakii]|uniref:Copper transport protein ATOX1 n=1 Tax=Paragonimus skrjabini miyazakii TaxID=59628 RepID=A0A8S9YRK4_9TREM|nr:hypothetical protein EG68_05040 [Paragonimus skrjabini miyazakii]